MVEIDERLLREVTYLSKGSHPNPEAGMCVMEAVSHVARAPWSDRPECACPAVTDYAIPINDKLPESFRQQLIRRIPLIAGSRADREVQTRRVFLMATHAIKVFAVKALERAGLTEEAARLRDLPDIVDRTTAKAARQAAYEIYFGDYGGDERKDFSSYVTRIAADAADGAADYALHAVAPESFHVGFIRKNVANAAASAAAEAEAWNEAIELFDALLDIR